LMQVATLDDSTAGPWNPASVLKLRRGRIMYTESLWVAANLL
jgi:hypothetical protein